ncbi:MAG: DNA-3-methyladenine glycosylase 2 family protein [Rhizobiaceae bacterium]|nr:DNA-3-methyladenine glycosylase 2 family protein [Rhizobiaceae bacterium]
MNSIKTADDVRRGLLALVELDPRLASVVSESGDVPLRHVEPGFAGLAHIIVSQLISRASANAIWGRMCAASGIPTAEWYASVPENGWREFGLSRAKADTLSRVAISITSGAFDLDRVSSMPARDALRELTSFKGIGAWTAEVYLMFCCGHPDIFPVGDVALRASVAMAFGRQNRPLPTDLAREAEVWAPWRSVAARLFWAYYAVKLNRNILPVG